VSNSNPTSFTCAATRTCQRQRHDPVRDNDTTCPSGAAVPPTSADSPHRLARLALLHLTAPAELGHQTLHRLPRLRDEEDGGVVAGDRGGGEDVEAAEHGAGVAEQHRRPLGVRHRGQWIDPGHGRSLPDHGSGRDRRLDDGSCAALAVLETRWTLRGLTALARGPARFRELAAVVPGVSRAMLSNRLRALESAELVRRTVDPGRPITSSDALIAAGEDLPEALEKLTEWATGSSVPTAS
jgi:DNA-binding HxlR family transcriptional regulator